MKSQPDNSLLEEIGSQNQKESYPVYLNVYNFWSCFNRFCQCFGLGVYHTGIEIFNDEYLYYGFDGDETGIGYLQPQGAAYQFAQRIHLGYTEYNYRQVDEHILEPLRLQFTGKISLKQAIDTIYLILTVITFHVDLQKCCKLVVKFLQKYIG